MGEANYYLKARFESAEAAERALPQVLKLLQRTADCYAAWQGDRDGGAARFSAYKDVFKTLGITSKDWDNDLAGQLDSPLVARGDGTYENEEQLGTDGPVLMFSGEVWHFANWTGFERALLKMGAIKVAWLSDEHMNPFDAITV